MMVGGGGDSDSSIQAFVARQKSLLELELRSEEGEEKEAASSGKRAFADKEEERPQNVLRGLEVDSVTVGLYGRTVVHLSSRSDQRRPQQQRQGGDGGNDEGEQDATTTTVMASGDQRLLPAHRLTVGDEVEILSKGSRQQHSGTSSASGGKSCGNSPGGVICELTETTISIAMFADRRSGGNASKKSDNIKTKPGSSNQNDAVDDDDEYGLGQPPLTVLPRSSAAVHRKMVDALDELGKSGLGHAAAGQVIKAIFCPDDNIDATASNRASKKNGNDDEEQQQEQRRHATVAAYNPNLDQSQLEAIDFALNGDEEGCSVALIHGPPGTGKTTTVVELIHRAVYEKGWRVLVTAPSNVAVDNVLEKLVAPRMNQAPSSSRQARKKDGNNNALQRRKLRTVRLGHPARIKQQIQPYSLESLVQGADGTEVVNDVRNELSSYVKILSDPNSRFSDRRVARREVKVLRSELRRREEAVVSDLIMNANVVLATNVGAANSVLDKCLTSKREGGFDLVVIDEAAQALEASCWIPILRGRRLVLAGDHRQLPPTIKCNDGKVQRGLGQTLFERVLKVYGDDRLEKSRKGKGRVSRMLRTQYRMNANIAEWANNVTYGGNLLSHDSVKDHTLSDLPHVVASANADADENQGDSVSFPALLLVDTAGCDMHESINSAGSRYNEGEARIVSLHVQTLLRMGVDPKEIAVISPYNGQVELIRSHLLPAVPSLEIRSVDGFQGGEREAVILSLVRSSERGGAEGGIGFLRDERRLNVAVTRARRHCCVTCDSETVSRSAFIKDLVGWMEEKGDYRSAAELVADDTVVGSASGNSGDVQGATVSSKSEHRELNQKPPPAPPSRTKVQGIEKAVKKQPKSEEQRRKDIMDKIGSFADNGSKGAEMIVGTNLSKFDELVACELAQQLGLEQRVEGSINRKFIIRKVSDGDVMRENDDDEATKVAPCAKSAFAALNLEGDSDSGISDEEEVKGENTLLASLAKERMERQKQQQSLQQEWSTPSNPKAGKKGKGKKKKKKKPGKKAAAAAETNADDGPNDDDCDDMAFLDAQIERVQTSHGRKVEGSGKAYKSIINGVLLTKPPPPEPKRDERASNALKAKLKKAGDDRKAKGKKKK